MDCPRCGQGNIPGSAVCFGCGAALAEAPAPEPTYPPRAERSGLREGLTRRRPDSRRAFRWNRLPVQDLLLPYLWRGLASLLPGLGQCLNRQWLKGLAFASAAVALGLLLLSGALDVNLGFALVLGLALVLAAVYDASMTAIPPELRQSLSWRHRFGLGALLASAILTVASVAFLLINHFFIFFRLGFDVPPFSLERGETLVAWHFPLAEDRPGRGDLVVLGGNYHLIGTLIGRSGDRVLIADGRIQVNGRFVPAHLSPRLDPNRRQEFIPDVLEAVVLVYQLQPGGQFAAQPRLVSCSGGIYRLLGVILPFGHRRSLGGAF